MLFGILFVLHTGIQWEFLPQELGFRSGMTCWRRLEEWNRAGVWQQLHELLLAEVPPVTGDVEEDRDSAVRFDARLSYERDAGRGHSPVRGVEVIDAEKESGSARDLTPYRRGLAFPVRPSKKDARLCAGRTDDHSALGTPVVGERRCILNG